MEKQTVVLADATDADVIAMAEDQLEAAVQVFFVRGGRVRGQRGWVVEKVEDVTTAELVEHFVTQLYGEVDELVGAAAEVPREVLVPELPADLETVTEWLSVRRGSRVDFRVPQRGDKRALMETVARNAAQSLMLHKTRRAGDLTARGRALQEIQDALQLDEAPLRIECYDISNLQGTDVVASMVVFEDGLARKSEYRRFAINSVGSGALPADPDPHADPDTDSEPVDRATANDVAAIHEVITRRFRRYLDERAASDLQMDELPEPDESDPRGSVRTRIDPDTGRPRKFAYTPNLVVVDGGQPQVTAAQRALDELGIDDIALVGLAKRLEEVWRPGDPDPVILPRSSEGLYLLQRIRDEAHRFAISYHRAKRSASMTRSALEGIPGLGSTRRAALLRHFGSVKRVRAATVDELAEVEGIGRADGGAGARGTSRDGECGARDGECGARDGKCGGRQGEGHVSVTLPVPEQEPLQLVVLTGLSGAGRSTAAKCLEDLGWFVVDNLPPGLLDTMVELGTRSGGAITKIAAVVDVRSRGFTSDLQSALSSLERRGAEPQVLFLEASDDELVRRFENVRRPHPLQGDGRLVDGIARERELLRDVRGEAGLVLDTTRLNVHELRAKIVVRVRRRERTHDARDCRVVRLQVRSAGRRRPRR